MGEFHGTPLEENQEKEATKTVALMIIDVHGYLVHSCSFLSSVFLQMLPFLPAQASKRCRFGPRAMDLAVGFHVTFKPPPSPLHLVKPTQIRDACSPRRVLDWCARLTQETIKQFCSFMFFPFDGCVNTIE